MAMTVGKGGGAKSDINITPLVDVLLVLLVIFMVITPITPTGLDALVPQPQQDRPRAEIEEGRTIVVQVFHRVPPARPGIKINQDDVSWDALQARLTDIYKRRAERVMFVKGDNRVEFAEVARVIDIGHAAGADKVGLITAKVESGQ